MASFLQSPEWQEIQERGGRKTYRRPLGGDSLLFIEHRLPFHQRYLYMPRPLIRDGAALSALAAELASETGALFLRIEPEKEFKVRNSKFKVTRVPPLQPTDTVVIDLAQDDAVLLAAMHPKTRYNIRLAEKQGVSVKQRGDSAFNDFYRLLSGTASRDGFRLHPRGHYLHLLETRSGEFSNELFFALWRGNVAAAAMVNFYRGVATYLHGGSDRRFGSVMAPHLLHWRIIQDARARGCRAYDLWGVDEIRWPGVTRFKLGFGGERQRYPGACDIVFRPFRYQCYCFARSIRFG